MSAHLLVARALAGVSVLRQPEGERPLQLAPAVRPGAVEGGVAALVTGGRKLCELVLQARQGRQVGPGAAGHGRGSDQHINDTLSIGHEGEQQP